MFENTGDIEGVGQGADADNQLVIAELEGGGVGREGAATHHHFLAKVDRVRCSEVEVFGVLESHIAHWLDYRTEVKTHEMYALSFFIKRNATQCLAPCIGTN